MTDSDAAESPLESATDAAGARATEAFSVLGNETRLSILLALWEAFDPFAEENAVPFEGLREQVGVGDSDRFTYHLQKLTDQFVDKTHAGYELRRAGHQIIRTVIAGTGLEGERLSPTEVDAECPRCRGPLKLTYQDTWLYLCCTDCEGHYGERSHRPEGMLAGLPFDPAGMTDRDPMEMWQTAVKRAYNEMKSGIEGFCDTCSGPVRTALDVCDDHDEDGLCDACGRHWAVLAHIRCPVCKNHHRGPPRTLVMHHPAVVAFYHERGFPFQYEVDDPDIEERRGDLVGEHEQELVSGDPVRVRVTVAYEGDELRLTLDENLDVIEVGEPDP